MKTVAGLGLGLLLAGGSNASGGAAVAAPLDPAALPLIARVDERFQSYNVEMAEIIGGRFWKPYAHMSATDTPPEKIDVGGDPNLFEARPPSDLSDRRLRALAAALGPAYVWISGTWANSVYFQNDDAPALPSAPEGFNGVLTRTEWRGALDFAKTVDARLVTSFAVSKGVRDASGAWTPSQAKALLDYTRSIGGEIFAAELFNEPNLASFGAGLKGYDAAAFARDSAAFSSFAAQAAPTLKLIGPGNVTTANLPIPGAPTPDAFSPRRHLRILNRSGGVTVLALNTGVQAAPLALAGGPIEVYALSAASLASGTILLNGTVGSGDRLPSLQPKRMRATHFSLAPRSIDSPAGGCY